MIFKNFFLAYINVKCLAKHSEVPTHSSHSVINVILLFSRLSHWVG